MESSRFGSAFSCDFYFGTFTLYVRFIFVYNCIVCTMCTIFVLFYFSDTNTPRPCESIYISWYAHEHIREDMREDMRDVRTLDSMTGTEVAVTLLAADGVR